VRQPKLIHSCSCLKLLHLTHLRFAIRDSIAPAIVRDLWTHSASAGTSKGSRCRRSRAPYSSKPCLRPMGTALRFLGRAPFSSRPCLLTMKTALHFHGGMSRHRLNDSWNIGAKFVVALRDHGRLFRPRKALRETMTASRPFQLSSSSSSTKHSRHSPPPSACAQNAVQCTMCGAIIERRPPTESSSNGLSATRIPTSFSQPWVPNKPTIDGNETLFPGQDLRLIRLNFRISI
jgi:hypothetical protein